MARCPPLPAAMAGGYGSDSSSSDEAEEEDEEDSVVAKVAHLRPAARSSVLESRPWAILVTCAIAGNTLAVAGDVDQPHTADRQVWHMLEDLFLLFFTVELTIRLAIQRWDFIEGDDKWWNVFDFAIVFFSIVERVVMWIMLHLGVRQQNMVAVFRSFRLVRILLTFRLVRHVKHLNLLAQGFFAAMQAVVWIAVLFVSEITISAIITTTIVGHHASEWVDDDREDVEMYFGTLLRSMITLFQMVTMDDWSSICTLVAQKMPSMRFFFIAYVVLTGFAMLSLLTGVMTEHITAVSTNADQVDRALEFAKCVDALQTDFRQSEGLTCDELSQLLVDSNVLNADSIGMVKRNPMETQDFHVEVFKCLDTDGSGKVSWDEFRKGLKHIRGTATSRQVCLLRAEVAHTMSDLRALGERQKALKPRPNTEFSDRLASLECKLKEMEIRWARTSTRTPPKSPGGLPAAL